MATRFEELRMQIPSGIRNYFFASLVCCTGTGLCNGPILCPGKSYEMGVLLLCVIKCNNKIQTDKLTNVQT